MVGRSFKGVTPEVMQALKGLVTALGEDGSLLQTKYEDSEEPGA